MLPLAEVISFAPICAVTKVCLCVCIYFINKHKIPVCYPCPHSVYSIDECMFVWMCVYMRVNHSRICDLLFRSVNTTFHPNVYVSWNEQEGKFSLYFPNVVFYIKGTLSLVYLEVNAKDIMNNNRLCIGRFSAMGGCKSPFFTPFQRRLSIARFTTWMR